MSIGSYIAIIVSIPLEEVKTETTQSRDIYDNHPNIIHSFEEININVYSRGYDIILRKTHGWCGEDKYDYCHLMIEPYTELDRKRIQNYNGDTSFDLERFEKGEYDKYILNHQTASLSEYKEAVKRFRELNIDTTIHYSYYVFDYLFDWNGPIDCCKVCGKNEKYDPPMEKKPPNQYGMDDWRVLNCEANNTPHKWYKWNIADTLGIPRFAVGYDVVVGGKSYEVGGTKQWQVDDPFDNKEDAQKECDRLNNQWRIK